MARLMVFGFAWLCALAWTPGAWADTLFAAGADGIYEFKFEPATGKLGPPIVASKLQATSSLAAHPAGWFLFATCDGGTAGGGKSPGGAQPGQLISFFVDPNRGSLEELGRVESGGKAGHVEVDARRSAVFVAIPGGGSVAGFPLGENGTLGARAVWIRHEGASVVLPLQAAPHPSQVRVSPDGRHLYVPDLGTDEVFIYEFTDKGVLRPAPVPTAKLGEGEGPCRLDFHPRLPMVYLVSEISSRLTVFRRDPQNGSLTALQSAGTTPREFRGRNACSDVRVHPGGNFLYVSNRGHHSVAVFRLDEQGYATPTGHRLTGGEAPRQLAVHASGKWLVAANQASGNLTVFGIDPRTGELKPSGEPAPVWAPSCLAFAPAP